MMKRILLIVLALFYASICLATNQKLVNIKIQGVDCQHCIKDLIANLTKLPNVEKVKFRNKTNQVTILMKPNKSPDPKLINKAIKNAGYLPEKTTASFLKSSSDKDANKLPIINLKIKNQPCESCHKKK
ncbi:hypothetical protein FOG18_03005 [Legionella israelensis]|nr:hypothetical protein FOG18_03005 [Legionella israelensis]